MIIMIANKTMTEIMIVIMVLIMLTVANKNMIKITMIIAMKNMVMMQSTEVYDYDHIMSSIMITIMIKNMNHKYD